MAVYFIQAGGSDGPVKIGFAVDPTKRLRQLQCGHHDELRLIRAIPGAAAVEGWMRERFKASHIRGEWHRFDPEMLTVGYRWVDVAHKAKRLERNRDRARERGRQRSKTWTPREPGLVGYGAQTRVSYDKAWRAFVAWRGGSEAVPVSDDEILRYLEDRLSKSAPHAVANRLAGISTVHQLKGGDRPSLRPAVRAWIKEWKRERSNG